MPRKKKAVPKKSFKKLMRGSIVIPLLVLVVVGFAVMLTSGTLVNKSATDPNEQYGEAQVQSTTGKQNLQLKNVSFQQKPTPVPATDCNHDNGSTTTKDCACQEYLIECKNHQCVRVYKSGLNPSVPEGDGEDCANHPMKSTYDTWCTSDGLTHGDGVYCLGKPVIYLYPTTTMPVHVDVITQGKIVVSNPLYPMGGWDVVARTDGLILYQGNSYRELFYESETQTLNRPKTGIVIDKNNLQKGLRNFIERLGLTRSDEQQEFLDWWIQRLKSIKTDKLFVSILEKDEKERVDKVVISPKPDTMIEFIVYFAPLSDGETVTPLVLPKTPERKGFTAIEWGGVIDTDPTN